MATWQFTFQLIPEKWAIKEKYSNKKLLDEKDEFDTYIVWKEDTLSKELIAELSKVLPLSNHSYHEDLIHFGNFQSNDIHLWIKNEKISEIQIRLDLQNININLIDKIISFSKKHKYSFFIIENKKLIPSNKNIFISSIKDSSAYKFIEKPIHFLENLS